MEPFAHRYTPTANREEVMQMEMQHSSSRAIDQNPQAWMQWQHEVLELLRADESGVLQVIEIDEVDWDALRGFYAIGRSPRSAIDHALARDF